MASLISAGNSIRVLSQMSRDAHGVRIQSPGILTAFFPAFVANAPSPSFHRTSLKVVDVQSGEGRLTVYFQTGLTSFDDKEIPARYPPTCRRPGRNGLELEL